MADFERVPPKVKRSELRDLLDVIAVNNGEDFIFYEKPITPMLELESRLQRNSIQQNSAGEIRHMEVFFDGPESDFDTPLGPDALLRDQGEQIGSVDTFRVVAWYGLQHDDEGDIISDSDWLDLLTGYDPMGIFPTIREQTHISCTYDGEERTCLLSTIRNVTFPPIPRPLVGSGGEHAHYAEFSVSVTDM